MYALLHSCLERDSLLKLDARLGYRNRDDPEKDWKLYAESIEERTLECSIDDPKEGHNYHCGLIPIFELGSLHHDYYLLNLRLPVTENSTHNKVSFLPSMILSNHSPG